MIRIVVQAILPKKDPIPRINMVGAQSLMRAFGNDGLKALKKYPPKPSKSRYKRGYDLRKGWKKVPSFSGGDFEMDIVNEGAVDKWGRYYAGHVQGFRHSGEQRQLRRYQRQGWFSLTDVHREIWPRYRNRVARALGIRPSRLRRVAAL